MKGTLIVSLVLTMVLVFVIVGVVAGVFSPQPAYAKRCPDGWELVCWGSWCPGGKDVCMGSSTYCCCK